MLNNLESVVIVISIIAASLAFLLFVHRVWPPEQRRQHNDLIGWQITVLGTSYAVVVGFMLYAVWTNFELASGNAEAEANCLVNVVRSSRGLARADNQAIQELGRQYVDIMLTKEWPAMSRESLSPLSHRSIEELWAAVTRAEIRTAAEQTSLDHAYTELSKMTEHRRLRQLQVNSGLPDILWAVLIIGGVITIVSACLFGSADLKLHFIQVTALALLISLLLVAISDINRPFQGSVHVSPVAFERARTALNESSYEKH